MHFKLKVKKGKALSRYKENLQRSIEEGSEGEAPGEHQIKEVPHVTVTLRALYTGPGECESWGFWEPGHSCPSEA